MSKVSNAMLMMPRNCVVMDTEEMICLEGGLELTQSEDYLSKKKCMSKALSLKSELGWTKISDYDLAAEIFAHAYAYYNAGTLLSMAADWGISKAADYLTSLEKINVDDGRDSRYWMAFNYLYAHPFTGLS